MFNAITLNQFVLEYESWDLRCFGILRSVEWGYHTDVSGQSICVIFKVQVVQEDAMYTKRKYAGGATLWYW